MTLDETIRGFEENPEATKAQMFREAFNIVWADTNYGELSILGKSDCEFDLYTINYAYFTEKLGWPCFCDGGIFEQIIELACTVVCSIYGFKSHYNDKPQA